MRARKNLLIVDDEATIRATLLQVFVQMGYAVREASDGFTALAQIRESVPDVLVSDLNMPGMSGFELLSVVRRRLPGVYVVAASGAYRGDGVPEGIAADAFYEKASKFESLLEIVRKGAVAPLPKVHEARLAAPLWVQPVKDHAEEVCVMISCPECLRGHREALRPEPLEVQETLCRDCETPIRYAVVKALDPATSQPYGAKAVTTARRANRSVPASAARVQGWG